jgi:hypothetical protein
VTSFVPGWALWFTFANRCLTFLFFNKIGLILMLLLGRAQAIAPRRLGQHVDPEKLARLITQVRKPILERPWGQFLNRFSRLRKKFAPRHEIAWSHRCVGASSRLGLLLKNFPQRPVYRSASGIASALETEVSEFRSRQGVRFLKGKHSNQYLFTYNDLIRRSLGR